MLRLKNISKKYYVANTTVDALKNVSVSFRKTEFVSVLGPSGCGKTTLLNIIGGLDKYTDGDLFINGKSTKTFKARDWDVYRNHRIGFVFQSYNLIPHQTILGNVELALTISGMSKKERMERAKKVLDKVGLKNQYKKKPNQLSGGQCQRVAIARALVNEPEILLADEPTGALDTQTSVQIMDLIKEISKERLVIMVTHNPELAETYSTRIVRLLDGELQSDSNPFTEEEEIEETNINQVEDIEKEKAKMSIPTAVRLSGQNLWSKRKRTTMVSIAGSIGIVGVSLVLAISSGIHNYINNMQDDLLSGNPIAIKETSYDMTSLMDTNKNSLIKELEIIDGKVNINKIMENLMSMKSTTDAILVKNTITKDYYTYIEDMPKEYYSAVQYGYGINIINNIYTDFKVNFNDKGKTQSLSSIVANYEAVLSETDYKDLTSYIGMFENSFAEAPGSEDYILTQYDVVSGKIATKKDEVMVVVNNKMAVADITFGELGYYNQKEFLNLAFAAAKDDAHDETIDKWRFSYDEIMDKKFTYYPNDVIYEANPLFGSDTNIVNSHTYKYSTDSITPNGKEVNLKVVGILKPKDTISYGCLTSGFYYTQDLTNYILEINKNSEIVSFLKENDESTYVSYNLSYMNHKDEEKTVQKYVGEQSSLLSSLIPIPGIGGMGGPNRSLSLRAVGGNSLTNDINIYPVNFEIKDKVTDYLDLWNKDVDITLSNGKILKKADRNEIKYADNVGLIIGMINNMIDIVSYALIAFTALSLLVSTVMIGIITYVSVVERIKEIGVIRSLGGRKKDVSNLFIAETTIIGLGSGIIGIGITYLISIILNSVMVKLIGFNIAALPFTSALIMILISVLLTLISGVMPARAAAKKDPVVALRTE